MGFDFSAVTLFMFIVGKESIWKWHLEDTHVDAE